MVSDADQSGLPDSWGEGDADMEMWGWMQMVPQVPRVPRVWSVEEARGGSGGFTSRPCHSASGVDMKHDLLSRLKQTKQTTTTTTTTTTTITT